LKKANRAIVKENDEIVLKNSELLENKITLNALTNEKTGEVIFEKNEKITNKSISKIEKMNLAN